MYQVMGVFEDIRCWLHLQLLLLFHCVCLCGRESSRGGVLECSHLPHIEILPLARSPSEGRLHFRTFEARPKIETSRGVVGNVMHVQSRDLASSSAHIDIHDPASPYFACRILFPFNYNCYLHVYWKQVLFLLNNFFWLLVHRWWPDLCPHFLESILL